MFSTTRSKLDIVPAAKVTRLGTVAGAEYVQLDKKADEYLLELGTVESPDDLAAIEGQRFVSLPIEAHDDFGRSMVIGTRLRRAVPVARGTFQREREKAERRAARPQATRLPTDALDGLSLLRPRVDTIWPAAPASAPSLLPVVPATGRYVPGRRKVRGRGLLEHLERQGVTLRVHGGKLLVTSEGRASAVAEVVDRAAPLLLGWLTGSPLTCELDHAGDPAEAWTILVGGLAACQWHAEGAQS